MRDKDGNELDALDLREWVDYGIAQGWISEPTCYNHDILPMNDSEAEMMDDGDDPCLQIIRLWDV